VRRGYRQGARSRARWAAYGLALAVLVVALAVPASAPASANNCCFAISINVVGGYSVDYGDTANYSRTGGYSSNWRWETREIADYSNGYLHIRHARVSVFFNESSSVKQYSLGSNGSSNATQEPIPCNPAYFNTFNVANSNTFVPTKASRLSLGSTPEGKPTITVGLSGPYAQIRANCATGEEGDHALEFNLDPWSFTIPGPRKRFLPNARLGDKFTPPRFSGGTLTYSHPYGDPPGASPHSFTGSSTVSLRIVHFPKSKLRIREKQLSQCTTAIRCHSSTHS
jgi:hypothetical protein